MNGTYQKQPPAPIPGNSIKAGGINRQTKGPPDLPPRGIARGNSIGSSGPPSRDTSLNRRIPPDVPPKRSSLTRSDLALFSDMVSIYLTRKKKLLRYLLPIFLTTTIFKCQFTKKNFL